MAQERGGGCNGYLIALLCLSDSSSQERGRISYLSHISNSVLSSIMLVMLISGS